MENNHKDAVTRLRKAIGSCDFAVLYSPIGDEPDVLAFLGKQEGFPNERFVVPPTKGPDPVELAREVRAKSEGVRACVFVPGRKFDSAGTRHGRGGGWYDRFLAALPREWVRIGVCDRSRFSTDPLPRRAWDEPMDWVVVHDGDAVQIFETNIR